MNIFVLDDSPVLSAQQMCDKHVIKMPLEVAQMLCSVWYRYGQGDDAPYKETHKNHPCTRWAGDNASNYTWLWEHGMELCREYTRRYNKIHKSQQVIMGRKLEECDFEFDNLTDDMTPHPQCMPDKYKFEGRAWVAYRNYYVGDKHSIAAWNKGRPRPNWFGEV
jgi:hypothetical protein|tara:strand:- start:3351 stop:3842 length:492 start_codon:yes stop_codon:yes gene_type:complete